MAKIRNAGIVLLCCFIPLFSFPVSALTLIAIMVVVSAASLCLRFEKFALPIAVCVLPAFALIPRFFALLPLLVFILAGQKKLFARWLFLPVFIPIAFFTGYNLIFTVAPLCVCAYILGRQGESAAMLEANLLALQDESEHRSKTLEEKNTELLAGRSMEVRLAVLEERTRIAREIHDNVGHMLTRSILQTGALMVTAKDNPEMQDSLESIKSTLSQAMDSVRQSVHNMHDEGTDLKARLETMAAEFDFCPVTLRFDSENITGDVRFLFLSAAREGLSNIARHSTATEAFISVTQFPALYQMTIRDNGRTQPQSLAKAQSIAKAQNLQKNAPGIGLQSLRERVESMGGNFRAERSNGFELFISIPKSEFLQ